MSKNNYNGKGSYSNKRGAKNYKKDKFKRTNSSKEVDRGRVEICDITSNSPEYYNKYPVDYDLATSIQWYKVLGQPVELQTCVTVNDGDYLQFPAHLPGIQRVDFIPGPGIATSGEDPVNRAYTQMMADLYAKTTGAQLNFQQADLAFLQISMSSILSMFGMIRRALAATEFWIARNSFYPRALIHSMGFDYEDLVANKPIYVSRYNSLAHMFNNIKLPKFLDIYNRQFALSHNIYVDEDSEFGQLYYYQPVGFYEYHDINGDDPAYCEFVKFDKFADQHGRFNMGIFIDALATALDAWYSSQDLYTINGALLRCYPDVPTVHIADLTMDDMINPVTDDYMAMQLMNADIIPLDMLASYSLNITQDPVKNILLYQPHASDDRSLGQGVNKFLRIFKDIASKDDNAEMTRLSVVTGSIPSNIEGYPYVEAIISAGTEIVTNVHVYSISAVDYTSTLELTNITSNNYMLENWSDETIGREVAAISLFRYIPFIPVPSGQHTPVPLGDLYNYTVVSRKVISNLNRVCLLSLWKVDL